MTIVKSALELLDALFRRAKSAAAQRGIPFRELVTEALPEKLTANGPEQRPWMRSFGRLRALPKESARIDEIIKEEFAGIEPEDLK
jgi:hypothetical protein